MGLRFVIAFVLGVTLVVGAGGGALYAYGQQYTGRVLPGVSVADTDLSGLAPDAAVAALEAAYGSLGTGQVLLAGPDGELTIGYAELGRGPDTTAMLSAALAAGRHGEPVVDLIGAPQTAIRGVTLEPAVTYDPASLTEAVDAVAKAIDRNPKNATLAVADDWTYTTTPSVEGRVVDRAALAAAIEAAIGPLDAPAEVRLEVPFTTGAPAIETADVEAATAAADRMATDLVLTRGDDTWTIPAASIRKLISFVATADGTVVPVLDETGIDPLLKPIAKTVNQTAKSAGFKLSGNRVVAAGSSREGRKLDADGHPCGGPGRAAGTPGRNPGTRAGARGGDHAAQGDHRAGEGLRAEDARDLALEDLLPRLREQRLRRQHLDPRQAHQRPRRRARRDVRLLEDGRRRDEGKGLPPGRRHHQRQDRAPGRARGRDLLLLHDAVQRGAASRHEDGRAAQPLLLHRPLPEGPRRDRVPVRRRVHPDDELHQRHGLSRADPRHQHPERQRWMGHLRDLQRSQRAQGRDRPCGRQELPEGDRHDRVHQEPPEGDPQARGVPGQRHGCLAHGDGLRGRQGPPSQDLLLALRDDHRDRAGRDAWHHACSRPRPHPPTPSTTP